MTDSDDRVKYTEREDNHFLHVHTYTTETDVADDHQHMILGVSGTVRATDSSHIHRLRSRTSFLVDIGGGHWHWIDTMTDTTTALPDGTHAHYFTGTTSYDDGHSHTFSGVTGLGPNDNHPCPPDPCDDDPIDPIDPPMSTYGKHKYGKRPE